jgi:hypothetical protein
MYLMYMYMYMYLPSYVALQIASAAPAFHSNQSSNRAELGAAEAELVFEIERAREVGQDNDGNHINDMALSSYSYYPD